MGRLVVVAEGGEDEDGDGVAVDFVNKAVLLCDSSRPCAAFVFAERLWDSAAGGWVVFQFFEEAEEFGVSGRCFFLERVDVLVGVFCEFNFVTHFVGV